MKDIIPFKKDIIFKTKLEEITSISLENTLHNNENEIDIPKNITTYLEEYNPSILVITGHDAYYKKKGSKDNVDNYKNSKFFINSVKLDSRLSFNM